MAEGVEQLANLVLLVTAREAYTHSRVMARGLDARWQVWRDGAWHDQMKLERKIVLPMLRIYAVRLGHLFPGRGQVLAGKMQLDVAGEQLYFLLEVIHEDDVIGALIERVSERDFATRIEPAAPQPHPYR